MEFYWYYFVINNHINLHNGINLYNKIIRKVTSFNSEHYKNLNGRLPSLWYLTGLVPMIWLSRVDASTIYAYVSFPHDNNLLQNFSSFTAVSYYRYFICFSSKNVAPKCELQVGLYMCNLRLSQNSVYSDSSLAKWPLVSSPYIHPPF